MITYRAPVQLLLQVQRYNGTTDTSFEMTAKYSTVLPSRLCCAAVSGEMQLYNIALADNSAGHFVFWSKISWEKMSPSRSTHLLHQGGPVVPILDHQVVVATGGDSY